MKKTLIALAGICISFASFANSANAQGTNNVMAFTDSKAFTRSLAYLIVLDDSLVSTNMADLNMVNTKAIKDFKNRFGNAIDEKWYKTAEGFISYFTVNGNATKALYDKKGHWLFTLRFYHEDQLPRDIRRIVRSAYYDYTITIVQEVQSNDNLVYIVHIEDKTSIKNLRVSQDGAMDVLEEFAKG